MRTTRFWNVFHQQDIYWLYLYLIYIKRIPPARNVGSEEEEKKNKNKNQKTKKKPNPIYDSLRSNTSYHIFPSTYYFFFYSTYTEKSQRKNVNQWETTLDQIFT